MDHTFGRLSGTYFSPQLEIISSLQSLLCTPLTFGACLSNILDHMAATYHETSFQFFTGFFYDQRKWHLFVFPSSVLLVNDIQFGLSPQGGALIRGLSRALYRGKAEETSFGLSLKAVHIEKGVCSQRALVIIEYVFHVFLQCLFNEVIFCGNYAIDPNLVL